MLAHCTAVGALPSAEQLEQLEQLGAPPGWRAKLGALALLGHSQKGMNSRQKLIMSNCAF